MSQVTDYLARIGAKGGKAGTGASKRRGNSAHYKRISKLAAKARKAKSGNGEYPKDQNKLKNENYDE
jgi:hypothetical protein